ncbi:MAG TPA: hypothetical protein VFB75_08450 [Burkholderiales bacterium]|nr:hypothetical protein [Burkholderiales bacterium]
MPFTGIVESTKSSGWSGCLKGLQRLVQVQLAEPAAVSDQLPGRNVLPTHEHDAILVPERPDFGDRLVA